MSWWVQARGLDNLGDAFLVGCPGGVALIDAGKGRGEVADRLLASGIENLDVVVCTHCDDDHSGGVPAVLRSIEVGELWVPGSWAWVLVGAVCRDEEEVEALLTASVDDLAVDDGSPAESVQRWADEQLADFSEDAERLTGTTLDALDSVGLLVDGIGRLENKDGMHPHLRAHLEALIGVVQPALQADIPVRFFSYEDAVADPRAYWRISGYPGVLSIVNAKEIEVDLCPPTSLLKAFALTVQNQRALVPFSAGPGALFCSDSAFEFSNVLPVPWARVSAVAAPHHGSANREHDRVYEQAISAGFEGWWVRSHNDKSFPSWPGAKWKALPQERRFCTRCKGDQAEGLPAQDVTFAGWGVPGLLRPWEGVQLVGSHRPCRCT